MKYIVNVAIDARIDVEVEADSFEEARSKAEIEAAYDDWNNLSYVSFDAVNAEREDGEFKDY